MSKIIFTLILSYLIGSIPTGYLLGKWIKKIDIRKHGSGNMGATNVFRTLGPAWGITTLGIDIFKGFICATLLPYFCGYSFLNQETLCVMFGATAIIGHVWTIFLKFKGGKGVATAAGVFFAINWPSTLLAFAIFFAIVAWKKYISLGSIIAAIVLPISMYFFSNKKLYFVISIVLAALVIIKHSSNIKRLLAGTENKISFTRRKT